MANSAKLVAGSARGARHRYVSASYPLRVEDRRLSGPSAPHELATRVRVCTARGRPGYSALMSALAPTPPERLLDGRGRPYFLWDDDMTLEVFRARLRDPDPQVRAYFLGKLMRQAKPDDVFAFATVDELVELLPAVTRYLGTTRDFWSWLLSRWKMMPDGAR